MPRTLTILSFSAVLLTAALCSCGQNLRKSTRKYAERMEILLSSTNDTLFTDSFYCYSATVSNSWQTYTAPDLTTAPIAVHAAPSQAPVIIIGKDRLTLKPSQTDTLLWFYKKGEGTIKAYKDSLSGEIDSVIIDSRVGQGNVIIRYAKK